MHGFSLALPMHPSWELPLLIAGSAFLRHAIEANDGRIRTVETMLFDDTAWKIWRLVIGAGHGLTGRTAGQGYGWRTPDSIEPAYVRAVAGRSVS